jgi:hypothetical protein
MPIMIKLGDQLREISTGTIYLVKLVDDQTVVLETLDGNKQVMIGASSLKEHGFDKEKKDHF